MSWKAWGTPFGSSQLVAQRLSADGSLIGSRFRLDQDTVKLSGHNTFDAQKVEPLANGGYAVVYASHQGAENEKDVYIRFFDGSDQPQADAQLLNTSVTTDQQTEVAITTLNDGRLVLTWASGGDWAMRDGQYVRAVVLNQDGSISPTAGSTDPFVVAEPAV